MIFLGGTSGFHYGQVVLQIHLSVGQVDFLTKFDPWPKYNSPLNTPGGHKFKSLLKLSNGWTDWHQIWHTCADSSGNGYTPKNCPLRHKVGHLGVLGAQTFKSLEKLSNVWTDWHQLWFTSADSSGNGHRLNTSRPTLPQGVFWGF